MSSLYIIPNNARMIMFVFSYGAIGLQLANILMLNTEPPEKWKVLKNILSIGILLFLILVAYTIGKICSLAFDGYFANPLPFLPLTRISGELKNTVFIISGLLAVTYVIRDFFVHVDKLMRSITRLSIKEAMDTIPVGNIFSNSQNRIIFMNSSMERAMKDLGISEYRKGRELWEEIGLLSVPMEKVLLNLESKSKNDSYLLRSAEGNAWEFSKSDLIIGKDFFTHISAIEVTEEDKLNRALNRQYNELKETNEEIDRIGETLEETQREQTILELKNRIHDIMGQRLSIIHQLLEENKHMNLSLKELKNLLDNMLKELRDKGTEDPKRVFETIRNSCKMIRVNVSLEGEFLGNPQQQILMLKIIREAVTNAIRHGKAKNILVTIREDEKDIFLEIENDGRNEKGEIIERDGIKGMRRRAKEHFGQLIVEPYPLFTIKLILPK